MKVQGVTRTPLFPPPALLLLLLLTADAAFVTLHVINANAWSNPLFSLDVERSYSDLFQLVKVLWLVILLGLTGMAIRAPLYAGWAVVFAYIAIEDMLDVHELAGAWIAPYLSTIELIELASRDVGELLTVGAAGAVLVAVLASLYRSSSADARSVSKDLLLLSLVLAFFAVFMDLPQTIVDHSSTDAVLIVLEDGGEMMALSLLAAYAFGLSLRNAKPAAARSGSAAHPLSRR